MRYPHQPGLNHAEKYKTNLNERDSWPRGALPRYPLQFRLRETVQPFVLLHLNEHTNHQRKQLCHRSRGNNQWTRGCPTILYCCMRPREQFCCTNQSNNQPEAGALQGPPVAGSRRGLAARAETAIERDPHECRSNNLPGAEAAIEQRAPHECCLKQQSIGSRSIRDVSRNPPRNRKNQRDGSSATKMDGTEVTISW